MIEVDIIISGYGDDWCKVTRRGDDVAEVVAQALAQISANIPTPKLVEIAEAAYRITREPS